MVGPGLGGLLFLGRRFEVERDWNRQLQLACSGAQVRRWVEMGHLNCCPVVPEPPLPLEQEVVL